MFTKLPKWVEVGAFCLTAIAGAINAIGLLGFQHQAVSHLTGTSTLLGLALVNLDMSGSIHLFLILLSFLAGAALSGVMINNMALKLAHSYSIALLIEGILLISAIIFLHDASNIGHLLASAACGLQNGMVSTYSGATIRTTHVSGIFTDLGTMLGAKLRGHALDARRARLYLILITGFVAGGSIGAYGFEQLSFTALAIPAGAAMLLAAVNSAFICMRKPDGLQ